MVNLFVFNLLLPKCYEMVSVSQKVIIHQCPSVLKIIQSCSFISMNGPLLYKLQAIIDILAHQLS